MRKSAGDPTNETDFLGYFDYFAVNDTRLGAAGTYRLTAPDQNGNLVINEYVNMTAQEYLQEDPDNIFALPAKPRCIQPPMLTEEQLAARIKLEQLFGVEI